MKFLNRREHIIILALWVIVLGTYPRAIMQHSAIYLSNGLGLIALSVVTAIAAIKPKFTFVTLLFALCLGTLDLVSFTYYFDFVFQFSIGGSPAIKIQLLSLTLLLILVVKRSSELIELWDVCFGQSKQTVQEISEKSKNTFKTRFNALSDQEIEHKLRHDLAPEARQALLEIQQDRKQGTDAALSKDY